MHRLTHFVIDLGHTIVFTLVTPIQTHALSDLLNDPQIGFGLSWWVNGLLAQLHHAVGVADRARLFRPSSSGQHHISQPSSFGHEDVLHHQMLQRRQGVARVVQIGVTHRWVLTHDVHAANLVRVTAIGQDLAHDLHHGVTGLVIQRGVPELLKPIMRRLVGDALVVGEHHGDQARITCTLHVVLPAQRVQTRAGFANLPRHGGQGNQATRVVCAVHMLAHAHPPQNHRTLGVCKCTRHFTQGLSRNATNRRHRLGAVALDVFFQGFEVVGTVLDEVFIHQTFLNHRVNQCIEHRHIGVGLELQSTPGVFANVGDARVGQHNFGAALGRILHPCGSHGMVGGGVGADHKNQLRMRHVVHLVAHRARAHAL